jgi:hypothetical protein
MTFLEMLDWLEGDRRRVAKLMCSPEEGLVLYAVVDSVLWECSHWNDWGFQLGNWTAVATTSIEGMRELTNGVYTTYTQEADE